MQHFHDHFPGKHGLASCAFNFFLNLYWTYASSWDSPKVFILSFTSSKCIFLGCPISTNHLPSIYLPVVAQHLLLSVFKLSQSALRNYQTDGSNTNRHLQFSSTTSKKTHIHIWLFLPTKKRLYQSTVNQPLVSLVSDLQQAEPALQTKNLQQYSN